MRTTDYMMYMCVETTMPFRNGWTITSGRGSGNGCVMDPRGYRQTQLWLIQIVRRFNEGEVEVMSFHLSCCDRCSGCRDRFISEEIFTIGTILYSI
jgi:hypothetical protein